MPSPSSKREHPGVTIHKIVSEVDRTRASFSATCTPCWRAWLLAALVVWLFLRDWRATAVTAVAMPASLIPTFAFMRIVGFSLNTVTLLGLTLVIGILVDDAIVEIENIEKRVFVGMRPYDAAIEGADQIGLAVVATTFAIVAVFLPVGMMPGIPGQFFREFGITVVGGRAVLPGRRPAAHASDGGLLPQAQDGARAAAAAEGLHRHPGLGARPPDGCRWPSAAVIFIGSVMLMGPLKKGVQPEGNPNYIYVNIEGRRARRWRTCARVVDQVGRPARPPARDRARLRPGRRRRCLVRPGSFAAAPASTRARWSRC